LIRFFRRGAAVAEAILYLCVPLFPSFITLTTASVPGISAVPAALMIAVLAVLTVLIAYGIGFFIVQRAAAPPVLIPLAAVAASATLSTIVGFDPRDGLVFTAIFVSTVLWFWFTMRTYELPGVAAAIWYSFAVAGTLGAFAAIVMVLTRFPAAEYTIGNGRAIGTFVLPGELAGYLIVFLPVMLGLAQVARARALRALAAFGFVVGIVALVMTFSRTGWIGAASAMAFLVLMRARTHAAALVPALGIVFAAFIAVLVLFNAHHNPSENFTRLSIWQTAIAVAERFPLTGVGPFGFSRLYAALRLPGGDAVAFHAHSLYLTFFAELGALGCAAWLWAAWEFVREYLCRLREATPESATLALAVGAGLCGVLVQGLIDTVSVVIFGLLLPTLALALCAARSGTAGA
jgi:O-antigen ligase